MAVLALGGCAREAPPAPTTAVAPTAPPSAPYVVVPWPLLPGTGSAQPDLVAAADGRLLLTWISTAPGRRPALMFAAFKDGQWPQVPRTVAVGTGLMVNWADTPHLAITPDGALWVHWLQKHGSGEEAYAYDVLLSRSRSDGRSWSPPVAVHDDGTSSEHGFVSMWPEAGDGLGVAWLDGRNSGAAGADGHGGGGGAMTLRAASFDINLQRATEVEVDGMVCDCCQTDVAMTAKGPLLAYRDRTAAEIRDIQVTRRDGATWTAPRVVHADSWFMPACPVNGPAVAARGNEAVVAWYTAAGNVPAVKLARSGDAGDRFDPPVTIDRGEAVQGRVDVAHDGNQVWVLWLREDAAGQSLWLARHDAALKHELQRIEVGRLQGRGRGTGFPQLALRQGVAYVVWTDVVDGQPQLRGAMVQPG